MLLNNAVKKQRAGTFYYGFVRKLQTLEFSQVKVGKSLKVMEAEALVGKVGR